MFPRLVHDYCYEASIVYNSLLIILILTKTPKHLRLVLIAPEIMRQNSHFTVFLDHT